MDFLNWLKTATKQNGDPLSDATVKHYYDGFKTISEEMFSNGIVSKKLEDMDLYELDLSIAIIFKNDSFIKKDKKGNKMYSNSLKRYRCFKYLSSDIGIIDLQEEERIKKDTGLDSTEKEIIVKARRGQGLFRDKLLDKYSYKCLITNISIPQTLIASHIKPWYLSNNFERTDVNNGLLLSATYDKLFDSGLITFTKNGEILISSLINKYNADLLGLSTKSKFDIKYNQSMEPYLKYHNNVIFIK